MPHVLRAVEGLECKPIEKVARVQLQGADSKAFDEQSQGDIPDGPPSRPDFALTRPATGRMLQPVWLCSTWLRSSSCSTHHKAVGFTQHKAKHCTSQAPHGPSPAASRLHGSQTAASSAETAGKQNNGATCEVETDALARRCNVRPHLLARILWEQALELAQHGAPHCHLLCGVLDAWDGVPTAAKPCKTA